MWQDTVPRVCCFWKCRSTVTGSVGLVYCKSVNENHEMTCCQSVQFTCLGLFGVGSMACMVYFFGINETTPQWQKSECDERILPLDYQSDSRYSRGYFSGNHTFSQEPWTQTFWVDVLQIPLEDRNKCTWTRKRAVVTHFASETHLAEFSLVASPSTSRASVSEGSTEVTSASMVCVHP